MVTWLYLGRADFLLLHDLTPIPAEEQVFWGDPQELIQIWPELELVAEFHCFQPSAYGRHGRLWRFRPNPATLAAVQQQFPWAGSHPSLTGAWTRTQNKGP
jgi:hypothetical protein